MTSAVADIQASKQAGPLIVHVVRQFLPNKGGLEDVVANLCRQLISRGYRVRVVTCNSLFSDPGRELPANETIDGIEIVRIPWSGSTRYPVAPKVFRHLVDADLVHVHAVDFFFDALAWGKLMHGRPMVATTHGGFFHTQKYAAIKKIWFNTATRLSALGYHSLICCSQSDARLFSKIADKRVRLIENGADVSKFSNCAALEARRRIVTIGRFSVNKRLDHLLDAMKALVARHDDWHLDIIGAESDLNRATLLKEIADRSLERNVALHVSIDDCSIRNIIARASLFASASEYEGFGLVAIEAMSAGLLPVLNANEAYKAMAETHPALMLTDFSDPEAAADTLTAAFARLEGDDLTLRRELLSDARAYAWDEVAQRYMDVYTETLTPKGKSPQLLRHRGQAA
ncbi:glycosyltransferase family 4 protein [Rhizobium sp. P38BS-XIX]|uniref:glycosyltransferase family 4 protein n=1 Tax=Rhizobium sp. P38BS-XIX TaxID=2726740 RepID=UPI001456A8FA|nr:glycosyltransferase family 4 protein [Rhizobium sp. P38BS-XIX]NLR99269.1 glycosyltransferase family 4 protein [Rhizobium sp. P38BS-XIX]